MDLVDETVVNYDLIEDVLRLLFVDEDSTLAPPDGADLSRGSVLIFLPGIGEIRALIEQLEGSRTFGRHQTFDIIPMHSSLSSQDQRRAFRRPPRGCRKIIVSTNVCGMDFAVTLYTERSFCFLCLLTSACFPQLNRRNECHYSRRGLR